MPRNQMWYNNSILLISEAEHDHVSICHTLFPSFYILFVLVDQQHIFLMDDGYCAC